jgi:DNA helicase-2/ATP-dependent DNA helicase PcrA
MITAESLVSALNEGQRQAVSSNAPRLLVLAGAGSGKTRVLVHRIAWLMVRGGLQTRHVLAVTFTNKAAAEMRHRLEGLIGPSASQLWMGTFHGIAHRLLRQHHEEARLPQSFQIIDGDDQQRLIRRVMKEMQLDENRWPVKQAQSYINSHKDEGRRASHIQHFGDPYNRTLSEVYSRYQDACDRGGLVDFAELLLRAHELWLKHPTLLAHYQQRFRHVLVDEFQDTNSIQYAWLRVLVGPQTGITIVGDDDQSIYGWRGAKVENIQAFSNDFGGAETVRLEQNYRSTGNILRAANAVIACNRARLGKNLWTSGGAGEAISLYPGFNDLDEARFIVEKIQEHLRGEAARSDIAILYRSNAQSRVLEDALMRAGVQYRIHGGQRFFDRLEIRNALAYLRLVGLRDDDPAFERVLNVPPRGIGERTLDLVREEARLRKVSLWNAALELINRKSLPGRAHNALRSFLSLIETLQQQVRGLPLGAVIDKVIKDSGLLDYHELDKTDKGEARGENLRELVTAASEFIHVDEDISPLVAFLNSVALDGGETGGDAPDAIQLMTLHAAKGLEFPVVFMAGVEEGLFPGNQSAEDPDRLEEERRLCYVGITRAMRKLYITYAESRRLYGSDQLHAPSRFLREIPRDVLEDVRSFTSITRPLAPTSQGWGGQGSSGHRNDRPFGHRSSGGGARQGDSGDWTSSTMTFGHKKEEASQAAPFRLGERVRHSTFGEGVVLAIAGNGDQMRVKVAFAKAGQKELMLQYAKLESLPG